MGDAPEDATSKFLGLAVDGDAEALEAMVSSKKVAVDVTETQSGGVTALCVAASRGHMNAVATLLRLGATPHKVVHTQCTWMLIQCFVAPQPEQQATCLAVARRADHRDVMLTPLLRARSKARRL